MKVIVTEMPETPRECLFSEFAAYGDGYYVCNLREYIPKADERNRGYKPKCICKDCSKCTLLEVLK